MVLRLAMGLCQSMVQRLAMDQFPHLSQGRIGDPTGIEWKLVQFIGVNSLTIFVPVPPLSLSVYAHTSTREMPGRASQAWWYDLGGYPSVSPCKIFSFSVLVLLAVWQGEILVRFVSLHKSRCPITVSDILFATKGVQELGTRQLVPHVRSGLLWPGRTRRLVKKQSPIFELWLVGSSPLCRNRIRLKGITSSRLMRFMSLTLFRS